MRARTAMAATALALGALSGCTAEWDPRNAAAGPGHVDATVDATDLHYLPAQVATSLGPDPEVGLDLERVGDGYRLTATDGDHQVVVAVEPTGVAELRQSEIGGAARRDAYAVDGAAGRIGWTDELATVTITAPGESEEVLVSLADAMVLVDTETYESFLADPGRTFPPGNAVLAELPLANRTLRLDITGSLAEYGLSVGLYGLGPEMGTDASLITTGDAASEADALKAWHEDGRNRAVLTVPDGFTGLTSTQKDLRWWQAEDARLGRVVLLDGDGDRTLRVTIEVEGQPDQKLRINPWDWY